MALEIRTEKVRKYIAKADGTRLLVGEIYAESRNEARRFCRIVARRGLVESPRGSLSIQKRCEGK